MQDKHTPSHRYDDIIGLPHHVSDRHAHMPGTDRAAQFAPFAALTGHDASIRETARLTDHPIELTEDRKAALNRILQYLLDHLEERLEVTITYFVPDSKKSGGAYVSTTGRIIKFQQNQRLIVMEDQTAIPIDSVYDVQMLSESAPHFWLTEM